MVRTILTPRKFKKLLTDCENKRQQIKETLISKCELTTEHQWLVQVNNIVYANMLSSWNDEDRDTVRQRLYTEKLTDVWRTLDPVARVAIDIP